MKRILFFTLTSTICLFIFQSIYAEVKLPAILSSNMVLQRNSDVALWGWSDISEEITMDIVDEDCIHPPKKKEVADRLLFNALNKTYGYKTVDCALPYLILRM